MLIYEAAILATTLDRIAPLDIVDIGSGSRADREIIQPHIAAAFNGHYVFWCDAKASPGVQVCDITNRASVKQLRCECVGEMVTACSLLEHVTDIDAAIANLVQLTTCWLVVSVPFQYPEHHCPIDNMWRPSPDELAQRIAAAGCTVTERYVTPPENFQGVEGAQASLVVARLANG